MRKRKTLMNVILANDWKRKIIAESLNEDERPPIPFIRTLKLANYPNKPESCFRVENTDWC